MQSTNGDPTATMELGSLPRDGYPSLAEWIARDKDYETFIFRRFDRLAARNILNLQSQLIDIEEQIDRLDEASRARRDIGLRSWENFAENAKNSRHPEDKARWDLYNELDQKMGRYQDALLRQSSIANLQRPRQRPLSAFKDWFKGENQNGRDTKPILSGAAQLMLDEKQDLAALKTPVDTDMLSRFLQDHWPLRGKKRHPYDTTTHFHERHVVWTVAIISTAIAVILLIGAIVVLYLVQKPERRLALIAAFTLLFALSVCLLTNAKRAEMFGATAAYAAVLVVFVSGGLAS